MTEHSSGLRRVSTTRPAHPTTRPASVGRRRLRGLSQSWQFRVGATIVALLIAVALLGPVLSPHGPTEFVGPGFTRGEGSTFFGTDYLGRDVLSRFLHGGRTVMVMALLAAVTGVGLGTAIALVAGYGPDRTDGVVMRLADVVLAFPSIVLALLLLSITGPSAAIVVLAVALSYAPRSGRILRAAVKTAAGMEYVQAAELAGAGRWTVRLREILPNISGPLMVEFGLRLTYSVALVASLSFLGFGLQPPTADWGLMINENRSGLEAQPWSVLLPVIGIALLSVGANLLTDGVARAAAGDEGTGE